jgi:hypothetical protein
MKKWKVLLPVAILAMSSLACTAAGWSIVRGSGNVEQKAYEVSGFDGVDLSTVGTVYIEIGEEEGLRVEAEDNLIEQLRIEVRGGTLHIGTNDFVSLFPTKPVYFHLKAKTLSSISVSGSGDVEAPALESRDFAVEVSGSGNVSVDELVTDGLDVKVSGSGDVHISDGEIGDQYVDISGSGAYKAEEVGAAEAQQITVDVTGSGQVELGTLDAEYLDVGISGAGRVSVADGRVDAQKVDIGGSGVYRAVSLESAEAEVHISGSGTAKVWVSEHLEAKVAGSGDVYYAGDPTVNESISGSGDVRSIDS